jgi:hypothetical protein
MKKREKLKKTQCLCGNKCCNNEIKGMRNFQMPEVILKPSSSDHLNCWQKGQWEVSVDPVTHCIWATISYTNWCNPNLGFAFVWTNCTSTNPDGSYNNPF